MESVWLDKGPAQGVEMGEEWNCNCSLTEARAKRPWRSSGEETRDVEQFVEGSTRQGKGRPAFYPGLWLPQCSFHSINLINLVKLRGRFLGRVFAMKYWINNRWQDEREINTRSCEGTGRSLLQWPGKVTNEARRRWVRGTERKDWKNKYCKGCTVRAQHPISYGRPSKRQDSMWLFSLLKTAASVWEQRGEWVGSWWGARESKQTSKKLCSTVEQSAPYVTVWNICHYNSSGKIHWKVVSAMALGERNVWLTDKGLPFILYLWIMSHGLIISNSKIIRKHFSSCVVNGRKCNRTIWKGSSRFFSPLEWGDLSTSGK